MENLDFKACVEQIQTEFHGEISLDHTQRMIYATDASVYQELPAAVAFPRDDHDIALLIELANQTGVGLIPRTAGTSLAGQVVGAGVVVDVSRFMNEILEIHCDDESNVAAGWVRVQPGVIRNELNAALQPYGLFFGPETSTSNRAMIGGMLGNNSCGSNSIVYGAIRDQTIEVTGFLSSGDRVTISAVTSEQPVVETGRGSSDPLKKITHSMVELLSPAKTQAEIRQQFPHPDVVRRNTGYAVDRLIESEVLGGNEGPLNLCQLIAGSEGTLFFATEIRLRCHPLPPSSSGVLCCHFSSVDQAFEATQAVMQSQPEFSDVTIFACELIDQYVLAGAARNHQQQQNLHFVQGHPEAILMVELRSEDRQSVQAAADLISNRLKSNRLGYAFPVLFGSDARAAWQIRKAGLGAVANVVGDTKPVTVIEDTAVAIKQLPSFMREVDDFLMNQFGVHCVHYGHAGAGEIHLRPMVNLKTVQGVQQFRQIAAGIAKIVKRYRGSLSGEHGDGRLRGEFLREMIGQQNYRLLLEVKKIWDPQNLFNPGKIVNAPAMDKSLRYVPNETAAATDENQPETLMSFRDTEGIGRAAEMCSGSGDCRKTEITGGVMCPSYMATRRERDSTRARANLLRQVIAQGDTANPLADHRVHDVMDLCLSCKGCKSECPSNVDVAKMKAEALHAFHQKHGVPARSRMIASYATQMARASKLPRLSNWLMTNRITSKLIKSRLGFDQRRSLPLLSSQTLRAWMGTHVPHPNSGQVGAVILFCDEFTNYLDVPVGIAAVEVLERLGYQVELVDHLESGRAAISKGLLTEAKRIAETNVRQLTEARQRNPRPIVGVEPSALLTLRDEYLDLVDLNMLPAAKTLAKSSYLVDEWVADHFGQHGVQRERFTAQPKTIRLHGHCHQKALSSLKPTINLLQAPTHYRVRLISAGCCGMAGSFGYETEHYDLSMQIGRLALFPAIEKEPVESQIAANGTSCRHQIEDGTGRIAKHPIQILREAFID